tara:strand:+ start:125 stop:2509 length:2385 start_codon:yes stop_codon:yes gene_type:complete
MKTKYSLLYSLIFLLSFHSNGQIIKELLSRKISKTSQNTETTNKRANASINTSILIYDYNQKKDTKILEKKYGLIKINQEYFVDAFIKSNNQIDVENLKSIGVKIFSEIKNIFTARIPLNSLENILDLEGVINVDIAKIVKPLLDNALTLSQVNQVHEGTNINQSYTGQGVVVGIIDVGFDYTHPTFYDENYTENRISRVWEQNNTNGPSPIINGTTFYGTEYSVSTDILNREKDIINETHGTHVAGIAAGSGGTPNSNFRGVAYESEIVLVSTRKTDITILHGIRYIIDYAISVNKPAVVNISIGGHYGPHDGSSNFDKELDYYLSDIGDGYVVVGSAGNDGNKKLHISKTMTADDDQLLSFLDLTSNLSPSEFISNNSYVNSTKFKIDIWGEANENFEIAVNIYNTSNNEFVDYTEYYSTNSPCAPCGDENEPIILYDDDLFFPDDIPITISTSIEYNKPHAEVEINNSSQDDIEKKILIEIKSTSGTIHAWQYNNKLISGGPYVNFTNLDYANTTDGDSNFTMTEIGGTGNSIISVGAYNTKSSTNMLWNDDDDDEKTHFDQSELLNIADFSSLGPTVDGRTKPDISAPGHVVVSSISSFDNRYTFDEIDFNIEARYANIVPEFVEYGNNFWDFGAMQGTSMSSPMVAGIVALMLQANPSLNFSEVKAILQSTALTDEYTGSIIPNNTWGFGKVNAQAAIQNIETSLSINDFGFDNFMLYPNPTNDFVNFDNSTLKFKNLEVINLIGQSILKLNLEDSNQNKLDISNFEKGLYLFKFSNKNDLRTFKIIKE